MKTGILCGTYRGDLAFWDYCHRALRKFAHGFAGIVLVVPREDRHLFERYAAPDLQVVYRDVPPGKGMLEHMAMVCQADLIVPPEWEIVAHLDCDCLFTEPVTPEDYMRDGCPLNCRERYTDFKDSFPTRYGWRQTVINALGIEPEWEMMIRFPMLHWRWVYPLVRAAVERHTGRPFFDYVLSGSNDFPWTFLDFDLLGAYILANCPDAYRWDDVHLPPLQPCGWYAQGPGEKLRFFWTHGGLTPVIRAEMERILG